MKLSTITYLFIVLLSVGSISFAQPKISKDEIPINIPSDVKVLIQQLYSPNAMERAKAAVELRGEKLAIPFLATILGDDAKLLWSAGYGFGGSSTSPGYEAAKALRYMGDAPVPVLVEVITNSDPVAMENAVLALSWIGDINGPKSLTPAVKPLITALDDENSSVQTFAAFTLWDIGWRPSDQKSLIKFLVSAQKFEELSKIGKPAVVPLIVKMKDKDCGARSGSARALGLIGDNSAIEPLIEVLKDEEPFVRKKAAEALREITGQDFGQDNGKWRKWWEYNKNKFLNRR